MVKPAVKSVADPNVIIIMKNYGDENRVVELLFPHKFSERGVGPEDFDQLRSRLEVFLLKKIKELFSAVGIDYCKAKFEAIFRRSQDFQNSDDNNKTSVRAFIKAMQELHHLE